MTPSQWHDDARNRDAGHDEMQAQVWRWMRSQGGTELWFPDRDSPGIRMHSAGVHVEYPFVIDKRIVGFGDLVRYYWLDYQPKVGQHRRCYSYHVVEIKPRIDSVGALIRQCRSTERIVSGLHKSSTGFSPDEVKFLIVPIVPYDDPKFAILKELSPYMPMPWDREKGCPYEP